MPYYPKEGVCDCTEAPLLEEQAIILFPNLGSPLLLAPGQSKASIFIAAPSSMRPKVAGQPLREEAVNMYKLVDQHLRVTTIDDKGEKNEAEGCTQTGTLFSDGKQCAQAKQHIKGWRVGEFKPGALISDRHGRPFATIAPAAAQLYTQVQDIYEIELDLSAPPFAKLKAPGSMNNLAWMVRLSKEDKKLKEFQELNYAEAQDLAIVRFLHSQQKRDPYHFDKLYEFRIPEPGSAFSWSSPGQLSDIQTLLKSWHPVKRMSQPVLKLGHLSDVHVSARHNALAQSPAKVLEDARAPWNRAVGAKVCNAFESLKALFEKMAGQGGGAERVDAVLLTGDLIDYNRNANPARFMSSVSSNTCVGIGEQWKKFNLLANVFDPVKGKDLYPRGLDDMLVFSLVREMYRKYKLPVIMTSGNHEAYQVPYGISARVEAGDMGNWAFKLGVLEATTINHRDAKRRMEDNARRSWPEGAVPNEARRAQKALKQDDAVERHREELEKASAWVNGKANGGMSRDHNMTIYEACLAYGPAYGHALTGYNFDGGQFDWFYALFTPLADVVYAYGAQPDDQSGAGAKQVIAALGWGIDENFKNLLGYFENGIDRQGTGILPRATESFSADQLKLVTQARQYKQTSKNASLTVASHFTIISFDEPEPYSNVEKKPERANMLPHDGPTGLPGMKAAFNQVNVGTCERNQATYLEQHISAPGRRGSGPAVDWHLSGHSHRSGVYKVRWQQDNARATATRRIQVISAKDPGIHSEQTVPKDSTTAFIVVSAGGGIGYQNLDGELSAWTGRAPAGNVLDPSSGKIKQVKTERSHADDGKGFNEKPRLCVALDYLHVMSGIEGKGGMGPNGAIEVPLSLTNMKEGYPKQLEVSFSRQMAALDCVQSMAIWTFTAGGTDEYEQAKRGQWQRLAPTLIRGKDPLSATLSFSGEEIVKLTQAMQSGVVARFPIPSKFEKGSEYRRIAQAFMEVTLKKPKPAGTGEDWAKDMLFENDPWVYPLDIQIGEAKLSPKSYWMFRRSAGERGEVPDWTWLYKTWGEVATKTGNQYPLPELVIRPYGPRPK